MSFWNYNFPHTRNTDTDLTEIIKMYYSVRTLPEQWESYQNMMNGNFADLKKFVTEYFDNLDVQQEINNKLDAMVADGTLTELISEIYINTRMVNVLDYGIVLNGSDVTEKLQQIINSANYPVYFPKGTYNVRQISLPNNTYIFDDAVIARIHNVPVIVNTNIDQFGTGGIYQTTADIKTAIVNGDANRINILGKLEVINSNIYSVIPESERQQYKGKNWIDGTVITDFSVNFAGLYKSNISGMENNIEIDWAHLNIGLCESTQVYNCSLNSASDNNIQFFLSTNCICHDNTFTNGNGGMVVSQNSENITFTDNILEYINWKAGGVNNYMFSIKNSLNVSVINNVIDGNNLTSSIGIAITYQGKSGKNNSALNNMIYNCGSGIVVEGDNSCTKIKGNSIYNCGNVNGGILIGVGCVDVSISDNTFANNKNECIKINGGDKLWINNNIVSTSVFFIRLFAALTNYKIYNNNGTGLTAGTGAIHYDNDIASAKFNAEYIYNNIFNISVIYLVNRTQSQNLIMQSNTIQRELLRPRMSDTPLNSPRQYVLPSNGVYMVLISLLSGGAVSGSAMIIVNTKIGSATGGVTHILYNTNSAITITSSITDLTLTVTCNPGTFAFTSPFLLAN